MPPPDSSGSLRFAPVQPHPGQGDDATPKIARGAPVKSPNPGRLVALEPVVDWRIPVSDDGRPLKPPEMRFDLRNTGETAVRVVSIERGCGCTNPEVSPTLIGPGESGVVKVTATPPAVGERLVWIRLHTDSPVAEDVELRIRLISERKPPFLLVADGDLAYVGDDLSKQSREIRVVAIEGQPRTKTPLVRSDLPFLKIGMPDVFDRPYPTLDAVERTYRFPVTFSSRPPTGTFSGTVTVEDPWGSKRDFQLLASGRVNPPIRVVPDRFNFTARGEAGDGPHASFLVLLKEPDDDIDIKTEKGTDGPFAIDKVSRDPTRKLATVRVSLREDHSGPGEDTLIVHTSRPGDGSARVPLSIAKGRSVAP